MINEGKKSRGQEVKQETNKPSPLVGEGWGEGLIAPYSGLPRSLRSLAMTLPCHPELVSGSHKTEMLKRVQHDMKSKFLVPQYLSAIVPSKKAAFTQPSRGTSEARVERHTTETLSFRGWRERCRLTRGAAFTLAEVLITLGIIGIVAAMTLPTLIQKHQERVTVNKVKKFYSVMSQAQLLAIKDNGYMDEWDFGNGNSQATILKVMSYFKPYLKISKDCGTQSGCLGNGTIKLLSGEDWGAYDNNSSYYKLILNDGTYMWASTGGYAKCVEQNISCMAIWIDVNGAKPPNTMGRDVFQFSMRKNAVIASTGINGTVESTSGFDSALYILRYGNMDYLKK